MILRIAGIFNALRKTMNYKFSEASLFFVESVPGVEENPNYA